MPGMPCLDQQEPALPVAWFSWGKGIFSGRSRRTWAASRAARRSSTLWASPTPSMPLGLAWLLHCQIPAKVQVKWLREAELKHGRVCMLAAWRLGQGILVKKSTCASIVLVFCLGDVAERAEKVRWVW